MDNELRCKKCGAVMRDPWSWARQTCDACDHAAALKRMQEAREREERR